MRVIMISLLLFYYSGYSQSYGRWENADSLHFTHYSYASVALENGNILVAGCSIFDSVFSDKCEIYDNETSKWRETNPLNIGRLALGLVRLDNGKVLCVGGYQDSTCELFDPITETWTFTGSFKQKRLFGQTISKLKDGRILLAGGYYVVEETSESNQLKICELYDPDLGTWKIVDSLNTRRVLSRSMVLDDGRLLITGGWLTSSCELFNPGTEQWQYADSMSISRFSHSINLLNDGKVLVTAGDSHDEEIGGFQKSCELYDPIEDQWIHVSPLSAIRTDHTSIEISNGRLLIFGGGVSSNFWEIYLLDSMKSIFMDSYPILKDEFTGHLLPNGKVIAIGGTEFTNDSPPNLFPSRTCEIFEEVINNMHKQNNTYRNFTLSSYPNPFNPKTTIEYQLPSNDFIDLSIYNLLGQKIVTLVSEIKNRGVHTIELNLSNLSGGLYICRLKTEYGMIGKKLFLIK